MGTLAAVIHGAPDMAQDLDLMPEPSRRNGERLAAVLAELRAVPFDDPERIDPRTGHDTWHLVTDAGLVDITASLSGIAGK